MAKMGIMLSFAIIPLICFIYSMYLIRTFNLNQHTHKIVKDEIDRLQGGGSKKDALPETKSVIEDLTGYPYDKVWNSSN